MRVLQPGDTIAPARSAITIGKFDGVHLGHRALLARTRTLADDIGGLAGVVTFDRHPMEVLRPGSAPRYLTPVPDRLQLLEAYGADFCIVLPLDAGVLNWPPAQFVKEIVVRAARARHVVTGEDFRYGRGRVGDIQSLRATGAQMGFEVHIVEPVLVGGRRASSYAVRNALTEGNLDLASAMLGRPYTIEGPVLEGRQLGRTLGFPTANLAFQSDVVAPANGVYAVRADWGQGEHRAVANLGVRPTVEGGSAPVLLEVHVLDWSGNLYGRTLKVTFDRRIRPEVRFGSLDELKEQIARDVTAARTP
jgi:riboflavin kinase/FMN adenylyltransferase